MDRRCIAYVKHIPLAVVLLSSALLTNVPAVRAELKGDYPDPDNKKKILICHVPPGNKDNPRTLSISKNALGGHDNHPDDYDGPCSEPESEPETEPESELV